MKTDKLYVAQSRGQGHVSQELQEANARLIASAPCLVEALVAIDKLSCNCPCMSLEAQKQFERCGEADRYKAELAGVIIAMREAARAALAKAKGEAS
mgnify:CR=1 FL=1